MKCEVNLKLIWSEAQTRSLLFINCNAFASVIRLGKAQCSIIEIERLALVLVQELRVRPG